MTKTKWWITILVCMNITLALMNLTGYYFIFLLPTGYIIPLLINIVVLSVIGFRSYRVKSFWIIAGLLVGVPIILVHGLFILLLENHYTKIHSPHNRQSLVIEYRQFTLGETSYMYDFYSTRFGLIGRHIEGQDFSIIDHNSRQLDGKSALGLGAEEWITKDIVRFSTFVGNKDVILQNLPELKKTIENYDKIQRDERLLTQKYNEQVEYSSEVDTTGIDHFMEMAEQKKDGETLEINGNRLVVRFDPLANESWIDVRNEEDKAPIPRQQCSRIAINEEAGFYILEECFHQWEYRLYPLKTKE
ncbi:hypothetical protein [Bacillus sp. B1-b2]|uniref:hypothetical protein n=1 Tax=Bacillus sp. B1-b2 TaxID=2653201 RepID=UPI00186A28AB|nr:hypothetical protein [Bacillus sp. B1-b2]